MSRIHTKRAVKTPSSVLRQRPKNSKLTPRPPPPALDGGGGRAGRLGLAGRWAGPALGGLGEPGGGWARRAGRWAGRANQAGDGPGEPGGGWAERHKGNLSGHTVWLEQNAYFGH